MTAALAVAFTIAAPGAARAQSDPYKTHMENGVKLYTDRNYPAAVVEFQAAYDARPSANPLVNIALCDKEMFRYPQAIAALEKAIAKHGATMDPSDKKAAEDAIAEMRALLGTVTVSVKPPNARLAIDGDDLAADAADKPIPLGPGAHKVSAHADGYTPAEQSVIVASGRDQAIALALVAEKGFVTIDAPDPRMTIAVDEQPVGTGAWSGMLAPGQHVVRMYGIDVPPYSVQIVVAAGVPLVVKKGQGGIPLPPPKKEDPPSRRGFYVLGLGSILFPLTHPASFLDPKPDFGAGYGLRAGFQVNTIAGFEASYEHSSITTLSTRDADATRPSNYRIVADRVAVGLRLMSSGRVVRFVGNFGGGFVIDGMTSNLFGVVKTSCAAAGNGTCPLDEHIVGVDAFAIAEAGLEVDLDHVLLDFVGEAQFQSTGNLTTTADQPSPFGAKPIVNVGPAIRVGYRFW